MISPLPKQTTHRRRRGTVLVWFVFIVPFMLLILLALTDYAGMSLARVQLKNAVDAASLSAVKSWEGNGSTAALQDAELVFAANPVIAQTLGGDNPHARALVVTDPLLDTDLATALTGTFLGYVADVGGQHVFHDLSIAADLPLPTDASLSRCVCVRKTVQVSSMTRHWLGLELGPYTITVESFARLSPDLGQPQLVHVDALASE